MSVRTVSTENSPIIYQPSESSSTLPSAATAAWLHPYQGDSASILRETIRNYMRKNNIYARFTIFVQSSGMGKSRMVDEMARKVLVIPVCLSEGDCMYFLHAKLSLLTELRSIPATR